MDADCPPVLFCIFNRPQLAARTFQAIRAARPSLLFVAADGPREHHASDQALCEQSRRIIEEVDWPCQVTPLFREKNLGCGDAMSSAITWFFEQVNEGIILEDDCVAHPSFFSYCGTLLDRYRTDERVWCVSGSNFQDGHWRGDGSYYFSRYNHCWGWATWRRCWQHYDRELTQWAKLKESRLFESVIETADERAYWAHIWDGLIRDGNTDIWCQRWAFACFSQGGLTALPNRNLVANVGFGLDATHCTGCDLNTAVQQGLPEIEHPSFVLRDHVADRYTFDNVYSPNPDGNRITFRRCWRAVKRRLNARRRRAATQQLGVV